MSYVIKLPSFIIFLLIMQIIFWFGARIGDDVLWLGTRSIKPDLDIVPEVPSEAMVKAFSFGEEQMYFRYGAYQIQNAGDSFGRSTPLKDYDYSKLLTWWTILDILDPVSDFVPSMASYYYGATQNPKKQIPYVVRYLEKHADKMPEKKWWWYTQAIYHAKHKVKDIETALRIATKLNELPKEVKMPLWARQMKAFILEEEGEYKQACEIILNIINTYENIPERELAFMLYFMKERINAMKETDSEVAPSCKALYEANKKN